MMRIQSLNALAFSNLSQNRGRTVLGAAAVALGTAMVVATDVMSRAMNAGVSGEESSGLLDFVVLLVTAM